MHLTISMKGQGFLDRSECVREDWHLAQGAAPHFGAIAPAASDLPAAWRRKHLADVLQGRISPLQSLASAGSAATASQHKGTRTAQGHKHTMEGNGISYEKDSISLKHNALVLICQHAARVLIRMTGKGGLTTS